MKCDMKWSSIVVAAGLMVLASASAFADDGYLTSFKSDYERVSKKLLDLAEATPADKFGWSPTDGVRKVSEVYIHVAGANFFICGALGVEMPEGFGPDAEQTVTKKEDVIAALKKSFDHVYKAVEARMGGDLDKEIDLFGGKRPVRDAFMILTTHAHEHLGQSIAYARTMGVVPPWSAGGN